MPLISPLMPVPLYAIHSPILLCRIMSELYAGDPPENFDLLCPAFRGYSWSSELTRIDRLRINDASAYLVPFPR